ncbi:MAG: hypothetical protein KDK10_06085 [Maritimibacter sp.]|nr:hypothetical protein [Maritimibacter sp.]
MSDSSHSHPRAPRGLDAARPAGSGRRWRPRRLHWHISIWSTVTVLLVALFLVLSSMALTGRVFVLPDWIEARVTRALNEALPSGSMTLGRVELGLTQAGRPRLRLVDLGLRDDSGLDLAQLNAVEGSFHVKPALLGRLEPRRLQLQGAQVTLRRLADGAFDLALGQNVGATGNLATMLDALDGLFDKGPLATVTTLSATNLTVTLEDARSGRIWQVTDGEMEIVPQPTYTDTIIRFNVFNQTEELASTEFSFRSARDSSEASLAARFENAAARDIAAQSPVLAFLQVIDAPISGALRTSIGAGGALDELVGTLKIDAGALSPTPGAKPAKFDGASIYIDFDPAAQRIDFTGLSVESEIGTVEAAGHVYLADFRNGWPGSLIGQIEIPYARLAPPGFFADPLEIDGGTADLRVRLAPFSVDIGQAVAFRGERRYEASGTVAASPEGWSIALDAGFDRGDLAEVLALWPVKVADKPRDWVGGHVLYGDAVDGLLAFRMVPGGKLTMNGTFGIENAAVQPIATLPPVEIAQGYGNLAPGRLAFAAEAATLTAPGGEVLDLSGTSYLIPDLKAHPQMGVVNLALAGTARGTMSVLNEKPFEIFRSAASNLGPDMARGQVAAKGRVTFPLGDGPIPPEAFRYDVTATLTDVTSDVLVAGKLLAADSLELHASNEGVEISGPARIGQAHALGSWSMPMVNGQPLASSVSGTVEITPQALSEFGLDAVADMVSGSARGRFDIDLGDPGDVPVLKLRTDLGGLAMAIPGTGWSKTEAETGRLQLRAILGARPEVTAMKIEVPGLTATGNITTAEGGGLGEARFRDVTIDRWFDGSVMLTGRGPDLPVAIAVTGGTIDLRATNFGTGGGGGARGPRMPLSLSLGRLIVSEGIQIQRLRGDFDLSGGLSGNFTGRFFDGNRVEGTVAQTDQGAAFRISSNEAGGVLRATNIFAKAQGGKLELILAPVEAAGTYEGEFTITDTRVVNAPAMAELLSAVSVVGLIDQLGGEGIRFTEVEGRFRLDPKAVTLYRSSAVGPSMGISLDGYYDMAGGTIDMQGVLSPLFIVNALGRVFSPRDGEGLVGFNFNLTGPAKSPEVQVNPLSILTPGVFREIFRRAPPQVPEAPAE